MKHTFPSLLSAAFVCLLAPAALGQGKEGQALVAAAAQRLVDESAVSADLRYKIDTAGHVLVGTGNYLQLGTGPEKLLRMELKMQIAERPASLLEICGADSYWIRRDLPPESVSLGRVNLVTLRASIGRGRQLAPTGSMPSADWIMLGGLPRLLAALEQSFDFGPATADELKFTAADRQSVENLPIWVVEGRWKPQRLASLVIGDPANIDEADWPEQLPSRVRLILGRNEGVLPLFPYRITYLRPAGAASAGREGEGGATEPELRELLTLELFNVQRKDDIDRGKFEYNPGAQQFEDLTTATIQRLGGESKMR